MRLSHRQPADSMASLLATFLLLAASTHAQNTDTDQTTAETTAATQTATAATTTARGTTTSVAKQTTAAAATTRAQTTQTSEGDASSTTAPTTSVTNAPSLTTGGSATAFHLTGLPTIAGAGIPTQGVPWTGGAAFMQKSTLPEGTVFICVGAILGALGLAILAWRGMVAWSLHRSVQRSATAARPSDTKAALLGRSPARPTTLYSTHGAMSSLSLDTTAALNPSAHAPTKSRLSTVLGSTTSTSTTRPSASLFFSPTAGAGAGLANPAASQPNRGSTYLPAGYYANTASSGPASGAFTTSVGGSGGSSMLPKLTPSPAAAGYTRASSFGPSPPSSPGLAPSSTATDGYNYARTSVVGSSVVGNAGGVYADSGAGRSEGWLDVPGTQQGRVPSAYLEDLLENHGRGPRERF